MLQSSTVVKGGPGQTPVGKAFGIPAVSKPGAPKDSLAHLRGGKGWQPGQPPPGVASSPAGKGWRPGQPPQGMANPAHRPPATFPNAKANAWRPGQPKTQPPAAKPKPGQPPEGKQPPVRAWPNQRPTQPVQREITQEEENEEHEEEQAEQADGEWQDDWQDNDENWSEKEPEQDKNDQKWGKTWDQKDQWARNDHGAWYKEDTAQKKQWGSQSWQQKEKGDQWAEEEQEEQDAEESEASQWGERQWPAKPAAKSEDVSKGKGSTKGKGGVAPNPSAGKGMVAQNSSKDGKGGAQAKSASFDALVKSTVAMLKDFHSVPQAEHTLAVQMIAKRCAQVMPRNVVLELASSLQEQSASQSGKAKGEAKGEAKAEAKGKTKGDAKGEAKGNAKGDAKGKAKGKTASWEAQEEEQESAFDENHLREVFENHLLKSAKEEGAVNWIVEWKRLAVPVSEHRDTLMLLLAVGYSHGETELQMACQAVSDLLKGKLVTDEVVEAAYKVLGENLEQIINDGGEYAWHAFSWLFFHMLPASQTTKWGLTSRPNWTWNHWWMFVDKLLNVLEQYRAFDVLVLTLSFIQDRSELNLRDQPLFVMQGRMAKIRTKLCTLGEMDDAKLYETISDFGLDLQG